MAAGGRASPAAQPDAAEAIPPELVNMQTMAQLERLRDDAHPAALQHGTTEQPPPPQEQVRSSCRAYVFRVHKCGLCFTSCVLEGVMRWCSAIMRMIRKYQIRPTLAPDHEQKGPSGSGGGGAGHGGGAANGKLVDPNAEDPDLLGLRTMATLTTGQRKAEGMEHPLSLI